MGENAPCEVLQSASGGLERWGGGASLARRHCLPGRPIRNRRNHRGEGASGLRSFSRRSIVRRPCG